MTQPTLGDVYGEFKDGGLGLGRRVLQGELGIIGASSLGPTTVQSIGRAQLTAKIADFGSGPLVSAMMDAVQGGAVVLRVLRIATAQVGVLGAPDNSKKVGTGTLTFSGTPLDAYELVIEILVSGATGTALFRWSVDGGDTWSDTTATGAAVVLTGTGLTAEFVDANPAAGSWLKADIISLVATGPVPTVGELQTAVDLMKASIYNPPMILIAGVTGNADWAALDTKGDDFLTVNRFTLFVCGARGPTAGESAAQWAAALPGEKTTTTEHISVVAGRAEIVTLDGQQKDRNGAALFAGWVSALPVNVAPGFVGLGALPGVLKLKPDGILDTDIATLDTKGFTTLRNYQDVDGVYVTNGRMIVGEASDFRYIESRRQLLKAATVVRPELIPYLQGEADEAGLAHLQAVAQAPLDRMVIAGECAAAQASIPEGQDIAATEEVQVEIRIKPKPKARWIKFTVGFSNAIGNE